MTYESEETLASVVDPDGIAVEEGDRLPGIPKHNFKLGLEWAVTGYFWLGANWSTPLISFCAAMTAKWRWPPNFP